MIVLRWFCSSARQHSLSSKSTGIKLARRSDGLAASFALPEAVCRPMLSDNVIVYCRPDNQRYCDGLGTGSDMWNVTLWRPTWGGRLCCLNNGRIAIVSVDCYRIRSRWTMPVELSTPVAIRRYRHYWVHQKGVNANIWYGSSSNKFLATKIQKLAKNWVYFNLYHRGLQGESH